MGGHERSWPLLFCAPTHPSTVYAYKIDYVNYHWWKTVEKS